MKEFKEVNVVLFLTEMFFEEKVDCCFEHEGIVDSDSPDVGLCQV